MLFQKGEGGLIKNDMPRNNDLIRNRIKAPVPLMVL